MPLDLYPYDQDTACVRNGRKYHDDNECDRDQLANVKDCSLDASQLQLRIYEQPCLT